VELICEFARALKIWLDVSKLAQFVTQSATDTRRVLDPLRLSVMRQDNSLISHTELSRLQPVSSTVDAYPQFSVHRTGSP